jgi:hypothetical protein
VCKLRSGKEVENKGRDVPAGMERVRTVRGVFECESSVHAVVYNSKY